MHHFSPSCFCLYIFHFTMKRRNCANHEQFISSAHHSCRRARDAEGAIRGKTPEQRISEISVAGWEKRTDHSLFRDAYDANTPHHHAAAAHAIIRSPIRNKYMARIINKYICDYDQPGYGQDFVWVVAWSCSLSLRFHKN